MSPMYSMSLWVGTYSYIGIPGFYVQTVAMIELNFEIFIQALPENVYSTRIGPELVMQWSAGSGP